MTAATERPARITALVVAWRSERFLPPCLASLAAQTVPLTVIVVDNGTDAALRAQLAAQYPAVQWLTPGKNIGFAAANNRAIRQATTEYILTVNADVTLAPDYAATLLAFLDAHPEYGSATGQGVVPGTEPPACDGLGHFLNRRRLADGRRSWQPAEIAAPGDRFGVCAAYALYRKAMLDDTAWRDEYFDATFVSYFEDVDLDWRAQWRGWKSRYLPQAVAQHHRGGAGGLRDRRILAQQYANRWLMLAKNEATALAARDYALLVTELHDDFARWRYDGVWLRVMLRLLRGLPAMLPRRRYYAQRRKATTAAMAAWYE